MQSIKQVSTPPTKPTNPNICFCQAIKPATTIIRLFGFFPIITEHKNGNCIFKKSNLWLIYSFIVIILFILQLIFMTDITDVVNIAKGKSLHELLASINDVVYGTYIAILTILCAIRFKSVCKCINSLTAILKEGLLCQSALLTIRRIQYGFVVLVIIIFVVQYTLLGWLHFSDSYLTDFSISTFLNRSMQNVTFLFYVLFICTISIFVGILGCFEKLTMTCLNYTPVHPMKEIDESNNEKEFLGLLKYRLCTENHTSLGKLAILSPPELVEHLRCLHEEISLIMYAMNDVMNPQLLFHTMVELTVLIVQWYAVIIYMAYEFSTPVAASIHVQNCLFVIVHTIGLFLFLKNAQHLHNMVHGLTNFLLEYSTRISSPEEHQQVRLFIEKLRLHRPITASGVFTLDLGIAGPICANILTYVLVALQFDVPKT